MLVLAQDLGLGGVGVDENVVSVDGAFLQLVFGPDKIRLTVKRRSHKLKPEV